MMNNHYRISGLQRYIYHRNISNKTELNVCEFYLCEPKHSRYLDPEKVKRFNKIDTESCNISIPVPCLYK